jgi:hypothetical protein
MADLGQKKILENFENLNFFQIFPIFSIFIFRFSGFFEALVIARETF